MVHKKFSIEAKIKVVIKAIVEVFYVDRIVKIAKLNIKVNQVNNRVY